MKLDLTSWKRAGSDTNVALTTDRQGNWIAVWASTDDLGGTIGTDSDILVARSADDGVTWSPPAPLDPAALSDGANASDNFARAATDGAGNWVVVWSQNPVLFSSDSDLVVTRSVDGGATWSIPAFLNSNALTDTGSDSSPDLATDSAGNWLAVWHSNQLTGVDPDIRWARSTDAGTTWSPVASVHDNAPADFGTDDLARVATDAAGAWVVVWRSTESFGGTLGTDYDVLAAPAPLCGRALQIGCRRPIRPEVSRIVFEQRPNPNENRMRWRWRRGGRDRRGGVR